MSLACKRFSGVHSFDAICRIINDIHGEFGLNISKLVATTTDNGSNFIKAFSEFGVINKNNFLTNNEEEVQLNNDTNSPNKKLEQYLPNHIRSASHTLNLIATTAMKNRLKADSFLYDKHKQIIKKCSSLWSKVNRPKSSQSIKSLLGNQLKYPVVTRWNTLYDPIKDMLLHRLKLSDLCKILGIEEFKDDDLEYLAEYVVLLQPIAEAIDFLQRDEGMIFGYLLPSLATILAKYTKMERRSNNLYLQTMAVKIKEFT